MIWTPRRGIHPAKRLAPRRRARPPAHTTNSAVGGTDRRRASAIREKSASSSSRDIRSSRSLVAFIAFASRAFARSPANRSGWHAFIRACTPHGCRRWWRQAAGRAQRGRRDTPRGRACRPCRCARRLGYDTVCNGVSINKGEEPRCMERLLNRPGRRLRREPSMGHSTSSTLVRKSSRRSKHHGALRAYARSYGRLGRPSPCGPSRWSRWHLLWALWPLAWLASLGVRRWWAMTKTGY